MATSKDTKTTKDEMKAPAGPTARSIKAENAMLHEKEARVGKKSSIAKLPRDEAGKRGH